MFDRLDDLLRKFEEIMNELSEPDVANNQERFRALMKEQSNLTPIVNAYREYKKCNQDIEDSLSMLESESDEEMREMLKEELSEAKKRVEALEKELEGLLEKYHDEGKEPPAAAKGMSWLKTNWKMSLEDSDRTAAGLITDGCGMGVKSLYRYLNQYQAADETSRSIARRLIRLEEQLTADLRPYL